MGSEEPARRWDGGGQKTIDETHANERRAMERLECPACRFKIHDESDHEPGCPNGDWDRDDVIEYIRKEAGF